MSVSSGQMQSTTSSDTENLFESSSERSSLIATVTSPHGKNHQLEFDRTENVFRFQLLDKSLTPTVLYRIDELLTVKTNRVKIRKGIPILPSEKQKNDSTTSKNLLYFYFLYKKTEHKWRLKELPIVFTNKTERDNWMKTIEESLKTLSKRPKNILVFINPFGGKKKAESIFKSATEPFFALTPGLEYKVILTERANHAKDCIMEMTEERWKTIDGMVSVGGDGLFNELLTGALLRTQKEAGKDIDSPDCSNLASPHIRFGIIGAGSANSIVSTINNTEDYATAAVNIVIGSDCAVDVCTVHKDNSLVRISANAISYGWLGDVLRDSERYRCLGPVRYQWSAFRTTARHPIYKGTVCFSLSSEETLNPNEHLPSCLKPCQQCKQSKSDVTSPDTPHYDYHWHTEFTHVICCVIPTVTPFTPLGLAPFTGIGDGTLDLALVPRISRYQNMQFLRKVAMYGGKGLYHMDDSLNVYRVVKWSYQPDADQVEPGVWNLDGEILEQPRDKPLHFKLHPQLISFFGCDAAKTKSSRRNESKKTTH